MRASSLSISVPSPDSEKFSCNKNCPYCISKMTGLASHNPKAFYRNLQKKVPYLAQLAQVNSVIITGKTEPLMLGESLYDICEPVAHFPLELQTNGMLLDDHTIDMLGQRGVNTIAISVDDMRQIRIFDKCAEACKRNGITLRATVNLTSKILQGSPEVVDYKALAIDIIDKFKNVGVEQVSFRKITIPDHAIDTAESLKAQEWIRSNICDEWVNTFLYGFDLLLKEKGCLISKLSFGANVYMFKGISCTTFGHCIQEENNSEDIRSLVYYEDGHMSASWYGSNYGRIF